MELSFNFTIKKERKKEKKKNNRGNILRTKIRDLI